MSDPTVKNKIQLLHERMEYFSKLLDEIDPENAGVDEIDQIIEMLDEIEEKCKEFNNKKHP